MARTICNAKTGNLECPKCKETEKMLENVPVSEFVAHVRAFQDKHEKCGEQE